MRLNCLRRDHRLHLQNNPDCAYRCWGEFEARLDESPGIPTPCQVGWAGSALEAAGIYMLDQDFCGTRLIERYGSSALMLIDLLIKLRATQPAILSLAIATALIEQVALERGDKNAAIEQIQKLTVSGRRLMLPLSSYPNSIATDSRLTDASAFSC